MPTLRASTLVLFGVTLACAASCDGSSGTTLLRLRGGAGTAGQHGNGMSGEGGESGAVDVPRGGSSGKSAGGASPGSGGTGARPSSAGRSGTPASGGTGATTAVAGSGGTLGVGRGGTQSVAGGDAGTADAAGAGGVGTPDQLSLCIRLGTSATALDETVTLDFENAFYDDCRVRWVFDLYYDESKNLDDRYKFLTQVGRFNYSLWGCSLTAPPDSFDLIYTPQPLTRADANALIDAYVRVATKDLSMSPDEIATMRAILTRLSEPLLISPDPGGFSQSRCDTTGGAAGAGGESGAGDGGQAGRGSGGEPSNGQAGTGRAGAG